MSANGNAPLSTHQESGSKSSTSSTTPQTRHNPIAAGRWSGISFILGNAIGGVIYFPLARLLTPTDFGLYTEANLLYLALLVVVEAGLTRALIQLSDGDRAITRAALWISIIGGTVGAMVCIAAAPLLAEVFSAPKLTPMLRMMAPGVLIASLGAVPNAILSRELDFRRKAWPETLTITAGGLAAVIGALAGLNHYSLALWTLCGATAGTIAAWVVCAQRPGLGLPNFSDMGQLLRRTAGVSSGDLAIYARLNTDYALTGRILGEAPLGVYSLAWNTSVGPLMFLNAFTEKAGFATFSRLKRNQEQLRNVFMAAYKLKAAVALPVFAACIAVTPDMVPALLGDKWLAATGPLMALFLLQIMRSTGVTGAQLVLAMGRGRIYAAIGFISLPLTVIAVLVGTRWGPTGVAWAMTIAVGGASLASLVIALSLLQVGFRQGLEALRPGLILLVITQPVVLMCIWLSRLLTDAIPFDEISPSLAALVRMGISLGAGLCVLGYAAGRLFHHAKPDIELLRLALEGEDPPAPPAAGPEPDGHEPRRPTPFPAPAHD